MSFSLSVLPAGMAGSPTCRPLWPDEAFGGYAVHAPSSIPEKSMNHARFVPDHPGVVGRVG